MTEGSTPQWWSMSGDQLMHMLQRVANGEDPDIVYIEEYANSEITQVNEDDDEE